MDWIWATHTWLYQLWLMHYAQSAHLYQISSPGCYFHERHDEFTQCNIAIFPWTMHRLGVSLCLQLPCECPNKLDQNQWSPFAFSCLVHSRTVCARGDLWWSSGWGIWRSPLQTYSPSYPAYWQISTQLPSSGPEGRAQRTMRPEPRCSATFWSPEQCGGKSQSVIKTQSV